MTEKPWQEAVGKAIEEVAEKTIEWETLRQQIIELWKSRGLEVSDIKVEPQAHGTFKWSISAKEKEGN